MIELFLAPLPQPIITLVVLLDKRDNTLLQGTHFSFLKKRMHSQVNVVRNISVLGLKVCNKNLFKFYVENSTFFYVENIFQKKIFHTRK